MKRRILSIAFIAISTILFTSVANNKEGFPKDKCKTECNRGEEMKKGRPGNCPKFNPFEGIELSDAQKEQLKSMVDECRADKHKKAQAKKEKLEAKQKERKEMHKKHLEKMKQILTPEQYVQYLENMVLNQHQKPMGPKPPHFHKKKCADRDSMCRKDLK